MLARVSASQKISNERRRLEQVDLDRKCLQVLRGLVHNEVVKLPANWEAEPAKCQA